MTKTSQRTAARSSYAGEFVGRSVTSELKAIEATVNELKKDPDRAKRMLQSAGIINAAGQLTKAYGGK